MTSVTRHQLSRLDIAILALANERARLLAPLDPDARAQASAVSDLLRRNGGPLSADGLRALFGALDQACAEVARGCSPFRAQSPVGVDPAARPRAGGLK